MKAATTVCSEVPALSWTRPADYLALTKPRVAVLVLFTVAAGNLLALGGHFDGLLLLHTVLGTALVAAGASALNQYLERTSDGLMRRTEIRPLPGGRLQPLEVLLFGSLLGVGGTAYLVLALPTPWAALAAAFTFVCYVLVYTPLKRRTWYNTLIGAIPGAMPPIIGWVAAPGAVLPDAIKLGAAATLFLVVFFWQIPHFYAIAWIYREDYARAGLQMLPVVDRRGNATGRHMVGFCAALLVVSLFPVALGVAGPVYLLGALVLGIGFLRPTLAFRTRRTTSEARRVVRASLIYLPALLALLLVDGLSRPMVQAVWR